MLFRSPPSGTNNVYVVYRNFQNGAQVTMPDGSVTYSKLANNLRIFTTDNLTATNTVVAGGSITAGTTVNAGTSVNAGTFVDANTYVNAGSYITAGTYMFANNSIHAGTYLWSNSYTSATTYITAGTNITAGGTIQGANLNLTGLSSVNTGYVLSYNPTTKVVTYDDNNPFNQSLNTTDSPTFAGLTLNGALTGSTWTYGGTVLRLTNTGAVLTTATSLTSAALTLNISGSTSYPAPPSTGEQVLYGVGASSGDRKSTRLNSSHT